MYNLTENQTHKGRKLALIPIIGSYSEFHYASPVQKFVQAQNFPNNLCVPHELNLNWKRNLTFLLQVQLMCSSVVKTWIANDT